VCGVASSKWIWNSENQTTLLGGPRLNPLRHTKTTTQHQDYEGHRIEIHKRADKSDLLIDNVPVAYGQLPNGMFFLDNYAYDWTNDLMELARRSIDYRGRVEKILAKRTAQKER
jgi:hypothetical protein